MDCVVAEGTGTKRNPVITAVSVFAQLYNEN